MVSARLLYFCFTFSFILLSINAHGGGEEEDEDEDHEGAMLEKIKAKFKLPVVVMISFDGFRFSYLERLKLLKKNSSIWSLIENGGVYDADGMNTTFATVTFPNHYTMVTGLFQESHGIISNWYYDPIKNISGDLRSNAVELKYLYGGEPIWETLGKTKRIDAACFMWAGCTYAKHLKYLTPYSKKPNWTKTVDQVGSWITSGAQFVSLYWSEPDSTGHSNGPDSIEMNQTLTELDDNVQYLLKKLDSVVDGLKGAIAINFILVSDHGMTNIKDTITIPWKSDLFAVHIAESAFWHVSPLEGKTDETVNYFKGFEQYLDVYRKNEIPYHWHYRNNDRIGDVLVVAKMGYILKNLTDQKTKPGGLHGFSPDLPDMRSVFVATGPAFKRPGDGLTTHIANTDIYLLICKIFGVTPAPNNGSDQSVLAILNQNYLKQVRMAPDHRSVTNLWIVGLSSISVILFALVIYLLHRASYQKRKQRSNISNVSKSQNGTTGFVYRRLPNEQIVPLLSDKSLENALDESDNESI